MTDENKMPGEISPLNEPKEQAPPLFGTSPVQDFIKELEDEGYGPAIEEGRKEFEKFKRDMDLEIIKKATSRLEKILQEKDHRLAILEGRLESRQILIKQLERRIDDLQEANNRYLARARKAEEALHKQAEQNVLAVRGSCDAPGFDACVDAEIKRMEGNE